MKISRRDAMKFGGLAAAGAAGLSLPLGRTVSGETPSLLTSANFPKRFVNPFQRLEVLSPTSRKVYDDGRTADCYTITARSGSANIVPGKVTPILGYDGRVPAKRVDVDGRGGRSCHRDSLAAPPAHGSAHQWISS